MLNSDNGRTTTARKKKKSEDAWCKGSEAHTEEEEVEKAKDVGMFLIKYCKGHYC